jgi:ubiquinone/menaquinone biosynthesis C-methylase UbiE
VLDYEQEAARYDETRGGVPRARAAAEAVLELLPADTRRLLDLGCGTGLVTAHITRPGLTRYGVDPAGAMARVAAGRLPHSAVVVGDGRALPYTNGAFDAVTIVWILHLLDDVPAVIAEAARVLRPGGILVTTVDKDTPHGAESDVAALLRSYRTRAASDAFEAVCGYGRDNGLEYAGETTFVGYGQGRVPVRTAADVRRGYFSSFVQQPSDGALETLAATIDALPDPEVARPDPTYRLIALGKSR